MGEWTTSASWEWPRSSWRTWTSLPQSAAGTSCSLPLLWQIPASDHSPDASPSPPWRAPPAPRAPRHRVDARTRTHMDTRTVNKQRPYLKCKTGRHNTPTCIWAKLRIPVAIHICHTRCCVPTSQSVFFFRWGSKFSAEQIWCMKTCSIFSAPHGTAATHLTPSSAFQAPEFIPAPSRCQFLNSLCQTEKKNFIF